MPIRKSQLYTAIWDSCDQLRGGMDASQYKDYVLVLLFVRYISDKYAGKDSDVVVPKGGSFADLAKLKGKPNIGEGINKVLSKLAEANELKGVIDAVDFNDEDKLGRGKEMQDRLSNLVAIFENPELDFSTNRAEGDDLLGDAYEYLMKNFAVQSGKSKGQFYTPAEVSRIIAKVIGAHSSSGRKQTVYDPTCGSGSLLLKVAAGTPKGISIYGQELDNSTAGLATLNMWLHNEPTAEIKKGQSTLSNPLFVDKSELKTFDYVVANPPFSYKAWRNGFNPEHDDYGRFEGFGIPPKKSGDYAFLLHILKSMKSTASGAVILPHGALFRGNAEGEIRKNIVSRGYIKGIIGLPANLFYGTGIPACIIVLDKRDAVSRKGIFMIDASKGYLKDGNKNRLRERDIRKIVDAWNEQLELPRFSRLVSNKEIEKQDFNLNIPRYIDTQEPDDIQDIEAHLKGGSPKSDIDALSPYWEICPTLRQTLFNDSVRPGYCELAVAPAEIKQTILSHPEFDTFRKTVLKTFDSWATKVIPILKGISQKDRPKAIIQPIADDLLATCAKLHLLDKYDVYQHLMTYWEEVMQDDVYILTTDGWEAGKQVTRLQRETKGKKKDIQGLEGLEGRLIPVSLMIDTYFTEDKKRLDQLAADMESSGSAMTELRDEHGGEEGLLSEVIDNDKVTKKAVQARITEIHDDVDFADELKVLMDYAALFEKDSETTKSIKAQQQLLEQKIVEKYPTLTLDEIKRLVVDDKWMAGLRLRVHSELERLSQRLSGRVSQLAARYERTLPALAKDVGNLTGKVSEHLTSMGFHI